MAHTTTLSRGAASLELRTFFSSSRGPDCICKGSQVVSLCVSEQQRTFKAPFNLFVSSLSTLAAASFS